MLENISYIGFEVDLNVTTVNIYINQVFVCGLHIFMIANQNSINLIKTLKFVTEQDDV